MNTDCVTDDMVPQITKPFSSVCKDPLNPHTKILWKSSNVCIHPLSAIRAGYIWSVASIYMSAGSMVEPVLINAWSPWSCVCIPTIMIGLTMIELLRLHTGQDSEHIEDISSPHCHESWWYWWPMALVMMWHCLSCIAIQNRNVNKRIINKAESFHTYFFSRCFHPQCALHSLYSTGIHFH